MGHYLQKSRDLFILLPLMMGLLGMIFIQYK